MGREHLLLPPRHLWRHLRMGPPAIHPMGLTGLSRGAGEDGRGGVGEGVFSCHDKAALRAHTRKGTFTRAEVTFTLSGCGRRDE